MGPLKVTNTSKKVKFADSLFLGSSRTVIQYVKKKKPQKNKQNKNLNPEGLQLFGTTENIGDVDQIHGKQCTEMH